MKQRHIIQRHIILGLCAALWLARPAYGADDFTVFTAANDPYATGVKVLAGKPIYFSSGVTANAKDGVTMTEQALASMTRLEANIAAAGCGLGDVIAVRTFLKPGATGAVDYAGWEKAWSEVFNSKKIANKPALTTVAMPLANANSGLIEIEYICVSKDPAKMAAASAALGLPMTNPNVKPFGTKEARIQAGIGIMPGSALYWTAGLTAPVINKDAPASSYESRGDMRTQARNTLMALKENLASVGLTLADVVYAKAFVGPDHNAGGKFDTEAWNASYAEFFNNPEQPHKPARLTMTTPSFASNAGGKPNTMIEIEFMAAFPKAPALFDEASFATKNVRGYGAPTAMFASGVAAKPGRSLYFSSGVMPTVGGDMKTQALSALESLKSGLAKAGGSFSEVVFLRAYLVPNADGTVDRDGWNAAYATFFNNAGQPQKPSRVTMPVTSLPKADSKIAIEIVAVVP